MTINNILKKENQENLDTYPHMTSISTLYNCLGPGQIRVLRLNNDLWVVAKDFMKFLGYSDTATMTRHLDTDETMSVKSVGMKTPHIVIKKEGLYSVINRSHLKYPDKFKSWVTHEIFNSIRQSDLQQLRLAEQKKDKAIEDINLNNQKIEYYRWQLEDSNTWKLARSISWLKDFFDVDQEGCKQFIGKKLTYESKRLGLEPRTIAYPSLGPVNIYHTEVVQRFHDKLIKDRSYMKRYRK